MTGHVTCSCGVQATKARTFKSCAYALIALSAVIVCLSAPTPAKADILFFEDFNGFSYSTDNPGLPLQSEGADEYWYGGRFEAPDGGSIDSDLAVQAFGGTGNATPVGRFEDDAGLLFQIDTLNLTSATLSFDWRTFQSETSDRLKVGFYVGDLSADFGVSRYHDWYAELGQAGAESWWANDWTQLLSVSANNSFTHQVFPLPVNEPYVWVAFWLDNGEGDHGKIDNVLVEGTPNIPEPSSVILAAIGAAMCIVVRFIRRCR